MEYEVPRKHRTEKKSQKIESKLKKFGLEKKLSPESIDVWVKYYREHSDLPTKIMKLKMHNEKQVIKLCMKQKLIPEKVREWVHFYQKYSSSVPIGFIEQQIQQRKDISLQTVVEENEVRSQCITDLAIKLGYSREDSVMWGKICAEMPHIRNDVIKKYMEAEEKHTPDDFKHVIYEFEICSAVLHNLAECPHLIYGGDYIYKADL